jgi:hypothetical protein
MYDDRFYNSDESIDLKLKDAVKRATPQNNCYPFTSEGRNDFIYSSETYVEKLKNKKKKKWVTTHIHRVTFTKVYTTNDKRRKKFH